MMTRTSKKLLSITTMFLACVVLSRSALGTPLETTINTGNEESVANIMDTIMTDDGITLVRVSDVKDELWTLAGDRVGTVLVRARFAGYNNTFGVIPGTDSGLNGFQGVASSLGGNGIAGNGGTESSLMDLGLSGDFRLAIETPTGTIWSSLASDNVDSMDHMVTWVDANDPFHYFVAFEDIAFPASDGDFNDVVIELHNVLDGPSSVPEPGTLALAVIGLAGFGYVRRRKALSLP